MRKVSKGKRHPRCQARAAATGKPCKMPALRGATHCYIHAPTTATKRAASRRKGGKRRRIGHASGSVPVGTIAELQEHLGGALADVLRLENTVRRGNVIARLLAVAARMIELRDHETRLDEIERSLTSLGRNP